MTFSVPANDQEVVDEVSGLVWSRCPQGQTWVDKHCDGTPGRFTQTEARAAARQRANARDADWRLPNAKELQHFFARIADAGPPAHKLFPALPSGWYWTSSTTIDTNTTNQYNYRNIERGVSEQNVTRLNYLHAWAVDIHSGQARGDIPKRERLLVWLVHDRHSTSEQKSP